MNQTLSIHKEVVCQFKEKCRSYPVRCNRCKNNKDSKKDYFQDIDDDKFSSKIFPYNVRY